MCTNASFVMPKKLILFLSLFFCNFACANVSDVTHKDLSEAQAKSQSDQWGSISGFLKGFQVSGALGTAILKVNDGMFGPVSIGGSEYDTLAVKRTTRQLNTRVGIGYNLFADRLSQNKFLNNVLVEINFYNSYGSAYGKFYQNVDSSNDSIAFSLGLNNKRIMIDVKPSLFTYRGFSPYLILGAGLGLLETTFYESDDNTQLPPKPRFTYQPHVNKKFVAECGGGLAYAINDHFGISLEYLYTMFSKISVARGVNTSNSHLSGSNPEFGNTYSNSVLLGLYAKI